MPQRQRPASQARRAEVRPAHRPLARPAQELRPQAVARHATSSWASARTCRSTCCSCATTTSPTWCRKTSATWAWSGRNVLEEKRLELHRAWPHAQLHRIAHAGLRPLPPVAGGAGRLHLRRPALARRQAHRHHLPVHARALSARAQYHRRHRHAVGRGRDRAAPRPRRPHLRPGVDRLDAAGQSPARSAKPCWRARPC